MSKCIVKFGELYSVGSPSADGEGLALTEDRTKAYVFAERGLALKHAIAWTGDAIGAGLPTPRVVRVKAASPNRKAKKK